MSEGHKTNSPRTDESAHEMEELELRTRMERIGRKILVLSGKGGVGKSTVATNLALALAQDGKKVGLLDVDLHGPSIPTILGLNGQHLGADPAGGIMPIRISENLSVVSVGLLLSADSDAVIWRGPMKYKVIRQFLKDVNWGCLDYLVVDSPPGTGDEPLSVAQMVGKDAWAVIVTTPQKVAIADVRRSVSFCITLNLHVAGIIENMSGLTCPHCGERFDLFKTGGGERLAAEMRVPFLGRIPIDPKIVDSGDDGHPFVQSFADSESARAFQAAIQPILDQDSPHLKKEIQTQGKETERMIIAIPTVNREVCMHFGHCDQFALVEVDKASKTILKIDYVTPPPHEPGVLPRWLHEKGANMIIAGGMGQRAQGLFAQNGIEVIIGATGGTPEGIVAAYFNQTLVTGQNPCDH